MNQSTQTTYKNTLYATTALFVFLMCAATSSKGLEHRVKSEAASPTTASEIAPSAPDAPELRAKLQGAL